MQRLPRARNVIWGAVFNSTCRPWPINQRMASEREGLWGFTAAPSDQIASLKSEPNRKDRILPYPWSPALPQGLAVVRSPTLGP